jgi:hypothetical protein
MAQMMNRVLRAGQLIKDEVSVFPAAASLKTGSSTGLASMLFFLTPDTLTPEKTRLGACNLEVNRFFSE